MSKKHLQIMLVGLLVLSPVSHAGFWGSLAGGAIGSSMASGNKSQAPDRMKKANQYLWDMHKANKLEEGYKFYLNYLEQSEDINYLDTVAKIYNDSGNKKKAIEIYEKRILPWVALEDEATKAEFKEYYEEIAGHAAKK